MQNVFNKNRIKAGQSLLPNADPVLPEMIARSDELSKTGTVSYQLRLKTLVPACNLLIDANFVKACQEALNGIKPF
jgi:hypothetical protein